MKIIHCEQQHFCQYVHIPCISHVWPNLPLHACWMLLSNQILNLNNTKWNGWRQWHPKNHNLEIIGASLSKPHTCIANCEYGCLSICWITNGHIPNLNWTNRNEGTRALQICTCAKAFQCSVRWMWQRTPHHVTQCRWIYWVRKTDCIWSERKGLLQDCSVAKDNRSEGDQSRPR